MPGLAASRMRAVSTVGPISGFPCAWGLKFKAAQGGRPVHPGWLARPP